MHLRGRSAIESVLTLAPHNPRLFVDIGLRAVDRADCPMAEVKPIYSMAIQVALNTCGETLGR
jgi:hypothetical protein